MTGIGLALPQLGEFVTASVVTDFCQRAEAVGYSSLWVQDHFLFPLHPRRGYAGIKNLPIPEAYRSVLAPTELLAAAAVSTTKPRLGTSILVAGNHWPAPLAQRLATIDLLSNGRLLAGLGVGWNDEEHEASGSDVRSRGARMDDFVPALLACWGDDPVSHEGPFFRIPPSTMRPKPVQDPHPPLLSGMWSPRGLERTRLYFDGWMPAGLDLEHVQSVVQKLNADRPAGREPLSVYYHTFVEMPTLGIRGDGALERLIAAARAAQAAGFTEMIIDANFWTGITSPDDWAAVPEQFAAVVAAVS